MEHALEWASVPALLIASMFSYFGEGFAPLLNLAICLAAGLLAGRALHLKEYFLGAGFIAIVVASTPLPLASKIFLLLGLACLGASAGAAAAFRTETVPA
jgi:hypothetical protein